MRSHSYDRLFSLSYWDASLGYTSTPHVAQAPILPGFPTDPVNIGRQLPLSGLLPPHFTPDSPDLIPVDHNPVPLTKGRRHLCLSLAMCWDRSLAALVRLLLRCL